MSLAQPIPSSQQRPRRSVGLWLVIVALAGLAVSLLGLWYLLQPAPNRNTLTIGSAAREAGIDIAIQPAIELDFMSKAEVLKLRVEAVQKYPGLIVGEYKPAEAVFGQIVDGRPWWGIVGHFHSGAGEDSIEGPSEESRFILNPYLLVVADFYGRADGQLSAPLYCAPRRLHWEPAAALAESDYDSECVAQMDGRFDLIVYNARDLNLNYIYVRYADSQNVTHWDPPTQAYAIPQFIHQGGSCGYPGGCNNMSPATPEIDSLTVTGLPAKVVAWLWRARPASVEQQPDMVFVLHFR